MDTNFKMLIVADDLTGAIDTAVTAQLMKLKPSVHWSIPEGVKDKVTVIDTETRNLTLKNAQEKMQKVTEKLQNSSEYNIIYKKIDSTLRGHIMMEVKALISAFKPELVIFNPAFPAVGRTIVDDDLLINEVPVKDTEFARDPLAPAYTGKITEWFNKNMDMTVYHHPINEIKSDMVLLNGCHTFDTVTDFHLRSLVKALPDIKKKRILLIGAAALATEFFALYKAVEKPVISFVGSVSQRAMDQVYYARKHGTKIIKLPVLTMYENKKMVAVIAEALELLEMGQDVIITAAEKKSDYEAALAYEKDKNLEAGTISRFIKELMGNLSREIIPKANVSGVLATGGDTAISVLQKLEVESTRVENEIVKGFVVSTLEDGKVPNLKIITKAGGFGSESDLYMCMQRLKEVKSNE